MIIDKYKNVNQGFYPAEKFVAINKYGELGCATMIGKSNPQMSVRTENGFSKYEGIVAYPGKP
jgi:hypothetical protein